MRGPARGQAYRRNVEVLQPQASNQALVGSFLDFPPTRQNGLRRMSRRAVGFTEESLRTSLRHRLASKHQNDPDTVLIDELGLCRGSVRVDLAVVNGQLHAYEIKSDRDSLRRLHTQAEVYSRVFDRVTIVCGDRHIPHALDIVPSWWELLRIVPDTQVPIFKCARRGRKNPNKDIRALAELLWIDEAMALLARRHALRGMRGKPRAVLWDRVCELFSSDDVAEAVRAHLKATAVKRGRPARQS